MPTLAGTTRSAPAGVKGFDADTQISAAAARQYLVQGYRFCLCYVGRVEMDPGDLTTAEAQDILGAGLALMVVQHVEEPGWAPGGALGTTYGANAATFAQQIGIPPGVNVWLDLEGVSTAASAGDVTAYCQNWYRQVAAAGYVPGVYVGWRPGLSGQQIYDLPFQHYWGAYNVDGDSTPGCGWCLKQSPGSGGTIVGIATSVYDDDVTQTDGEGRTVQWLSGGS
jgi:hypothetical protein